MQTKNLSLVGNPYNPGWIFLGLYISKWNGTDSRGNAWKSDEEIQNVVNSSVFTGLLANTYFDGNDLTNPIKHFIDERIYDYPMNDVSKHIYVYMRENPVELKDSIYRYSTTGDQQSFYCKYLTLKNDYYTIKYKLDILSKIIWIQFTILIYLIF